MGIFSPEYLINNQRNAYSLHNITRFILLQVLVSSEPSGLILKRCRSQWLRSLRSESAAARLLGLRVRIPPGYGYLSVMIVVCCQVEISASG